MRVGVPPCSLNHYFAMGSPLGQVWFSSHSIETKFSLDNWSVFLQDGVTLFGSDSNDLISIEGISWEWFSGSFSGWFFVILGSSGWL